MEYIVSAATDKGLVKETNQDSYGVKLLDTKVGKILIAVLCDGMGGYSKGEVASATVVEAFDEWIMGSLTGLCETGFCDDDIRSEWDRIIQDCNEKIKNYGNSNNISMGTTAVVLMLTDNKYYLLNVGDSRVYRIRDEAKPLTADQTVIANEIALGRLTEEQAKVDPRRSVLLQCIGASDVVIPDITVGKTEPDCVYMLCSDGFRHEITPEEIQAYLGPNTLIDVASMNDNIGYLISLNKQRQERDNITVITIRTY